LTQINFWVAGALAWHRIAGELIRCRARYPSSQSIRRNSSRDRCQHQDDEEPHPLRVPLQPGNLVGLATGDVFSPGL
jgi:hypothetical protein